MAKKSKESSIFQGNLFQAPEPQTQVEPIQTTKEVTTDLNQNQTPPPPEVRCPKCGGGAAKAMREPGKYYCVGPCSYGDNFYFEAP